MQIEEIKQKILAKEGRLKNTETGLSNTDKIGHSKKTKENSTNKSKRHKDKNNNQMQKQHKIFGVRYGSNR